MHRAPQAGGGGLCCIFGVRGGSLGQIGAATVWGWPAQPASVHNRMLITVSLISLAFLLIGRLCGEGPLKEEFLFVGIGRLELLQGDIVPLDLLLDSSLDLVVLPQTDATPDGYRYHGNGHQFLDPGGKLCPTEY